MFQSETPPAAPAHRRAAVIFCFLMLAMFMATLDQHVVSTALPTIVGEFAAIERFGWIGSAYLLAQSAIMPIYGKLGDLFGRKYLMIGAVFLFTLGSAACAMAWSMESLIGARVFQGLGAGGIMVSIFAINADLFPPRQRAKYQGFSSLVLMASGSIGPTLGGAMSQYLGWRSIFLINLPIGIIVLTALLLLLPGHRPDRQPRLDWQGALALALAIAGIVLWADSGSLFGSLTAWPALALPGVSLLALVLWLRIERRAPEPVIPLGLFRDRNFALLLIAAAANGAIAIGMVNYHALFLQMTSGLSPASAGLFFIAVTGGVTMGALSAGRLIAASGYYKPWMVLGLLLAMLCLSGLALLPLHAPLWVIVGLLIGLGVAIGLGQQGPVLGAQVAAPREDVGAATGAVTLSRMAGASLAISIYGAVLSGALLAVPDVEALAEMTPERMNRLMPSMHEAVATAYRDAFFWVYLAAFVIAGIGLLAASLLRPVVLPASRGRTPPDRLPTGPRPGNGVRG
jgi:EmrB/QacA subfamily drug resistance transporter